MNQTTFNKPFRVDVASISRWFIHLGRPPSHPCETHVFAGLQGIKQAGSDLEENVLRKNMFLAREQQTQTFALKTDAEKKMAREAHFRREFVKKTKPSF